MALRYKDTGNLHPDFHRLVNSTIKWVREHYGEQAVVEIFRRVAQDVYRSIHEDLKAGDPSQLIEHWRYYLDREGGEYTTEERHDGSFWMTVERCPAYWFLKEKGVEIDDDFRQQTILLNRFLGEGTPFEIVTEPLTPGSYRQGIVPRKEARP